MRDRMATWIVALPLAIVGLSAGRCEAEEDTGFDLRCLVDFASAAGSSEGAAKTSATLGLIYFLGRLDAVIPGFDIETQIERVSKTEPAERIEADRPRCVAALQARGEALMTAGRSIVQKHGSPAP